HMPRLMEDEQRSVEKRSVDLARAKIERDQPQSPDGKREQQRRARREHRRAHVLRHARQERAQPLGQRRLFLDKSDCAVRRFALAFDRGKLGENDPASGACRGQRLVHRQRLMVALRTTIVVRLGHSNASSFVVVAAVEPCYLLQGERSAKRFCLKNGTNSMPAMNPPMCARNATPPCPAGAPSWLNNCKPNHSRSTMPAGMRTV